MQSRVLGDNDTARRTRSNKTHRADNFSNYCQKYCPWEPCIDTRLKVPSETRRITRQSPVATEVPAFGNEANIVLVTAINLRGLLKNLIRLNENLQWRSGKMA